MNENLKKQTTWRKRKWGQWSLLSLMLFALIMALFIIPFVNRAEHVRFWQSTLSGNTVEISISNGEPSELATRLGIPFLLKKVFPDVATVYFNSVESIYVVEPDPELQPGIAKHLGLCSNLTHLHWHGEIGSAMARDMRGCENLSMLKLNGCPDTDALLDNVSRLKHLEVITFNECSISRRGIVNLKKMESLKLLLMHETEIAQEEIDELRKLLPNCYVFSFKKEDYGG